MTRPDHKHSRLSDLLAIPRYALRCAPALTVGTVTSIFVSVVLGSFIPVAMRGMLDNLDDGRRFAVACLGLAAVLIGLDLSFRVASACASALGARMAADVSNDVVDIALMRLSYREVQRQDNADLLRGVSSETPMLARLLMLEAQVASAFARFVIILALVWQVYAPLTLVVLVAIPSAALGRSSVRLGVQAEETASRSRVRLRSLVASVSDGRSSSELADSRCRDFFTSRIDEVSAGVEEVDRRLALRQGRQDAVAWLLYGVGFAASLLALTVGPVAPTTSVGDVAMVLLLVAMLRDQVAGILGVMPMLQQLLPVGRRLAGLRDLGSDDLQRPPEVAVSPLRSIRLQDVGFGYDEGSTVLSGVTFQASAGQTILVCGPNGSGKTTLATILLGLYVPSAGTIVVNGEEVPTSSWNRARITRVAAFQDVARLPVLVSEFLAMGGGDDAAVHEALGRAELEPARTRLSERLLAGGAAGWDPSPGQWQRLALARALAAVPAEIEVFDEATHGVDPLREERITAELFRRPHPGATRFVVSHRLKYAPLADAVLYLHEGSVVAFGTHEELIGYSAEYASFYRAWTSLYSHAGDPPTEGAS